MASSLKNKFASAALGLVASVPASQAAIIPYPFVMEYKSEIGDGYYSMWSDAFTKQSQTINSATFNVRTMFEEAQLQVTIYNDVSQYNSVTQTFERRDGFRFYDRQRSVFAFGASNLITTLDQTSMMYLLNNSHLLTANRGAQISTSPGAPVYELYDFQAYGFPAPGTSMLLGAGLMAAGLRRRRPMEAPEFSQR